MTDFSSLDKLMEFGLGLGIATQMMNTMNTTIARTAMPGVAINPGVYPAADLRNGQCENAQEAVPQPEYYIVHDEKVAGPFSEHQLDELIRKGIVGKKTFCWMPGQPQWNLAENIPQVNKLLLLNS